jgi:RNA polymerase sigma factor (sigma-70 family)
MQSHSQVRDFAQVVLPHLDAAHNLARWLIRDCATAEDVVQDAVVRACQYFPSFRGGCERAWLLRIVRNTAYSCIRARRRGSPISLSGGSVASDEAEEAGIDLPDPQPDPETRLAQRQEVAALHRALDELPVSLRECLVLREMEQLSYKAIARITDVPIGTVMSRLSRARQSLASRTAGGQIGYPAAKG